MSYREALQFLYSLRVFGQKLGLDSTRLLLERLDHPHHQLRFIHIAGTNGKGSVAAMCHAVLHAAGHRSGLYTSPHLVSFRERIQLGASLIPAADVARLVDRIRPLLAEVAALQEGRHPTFFETVTAMALCYFRDQQAEFVVWETGLGGRLDATNVVTPAVSVITTISHDHLEHLGPTLADIAREKCGVIKCGVPVVTCEQEDARVMQEIEQSSEAHESVLTVVGRDLQTTPAGDDRDGQDVRLTGSARWDGVYRLPLLGREQVLNCGLAVGALQTLSSRISTDSLREGLSHTDWPGRFQVIDGNPVVIVDGAHNPGAIRRVVDNLGQRFGGTPVAVLLGMLADKDVEEVCRLLAPIADSVVCVPISGERKSVAPGTLVRQLRKVRPEISVQTSASPRTGLRSLRQQHRGVVLVTGSLFLAGEILGEIAPPYGVTPD